MFDRADAGMLVLVVVVLAISYVLSRRSLVYHKRKSYKYPFFATRDRLVGLVAEGKLPEDSPVFTAFYGLSNSFISKANTRTLSGVIHVLREARERGIDPGEDAEWQRMEEALERSDAEVRQTVDGLFRAITAALVRNSSAVLFLRFCGEAARYWWKHKRQGDNHPPSRPHLPMPAAQKEACEFYQAYDNASKKLAMAA